MGRKPRVEYAGAIYHVIQRGNNREYIFDLDEDKLFLLREVEKRKVNTGFLLYGYVVMGNHYHLVLQTGEYPLSKVMHFINGSYGRYYNLSRGRTGHVFEGRYKAIPVQDERYLLAVLRYVHRNPVVAGICRRVAGYRWSSDHFYRKNLKQFVDIDLLLDMLSNDRKKAITQYIDFMEQEDALDYEKLDALGDDTFTLQNRPPKEKPIRKNLEQILKETGISPLEFDLIKKGSRKRNLIPYKAAYVREAIKYQYTLKEIGANIGISSVAVAKLMSVAGYQI